MKNRVVVFAPHPDDEILGCGGTIAKKISEGYEVIIVFLTDGRYAFSEMLNIDTDPTPSELKEIRKEEAKRGTKLLGIYPENLIFLDIEDGKLGENEEVAGKRIAEILSKSLPKEVYFPQEREFNHDHVVTNRLVKREISGFHPRPVEYQYVIGWVYPLNLVANVLPKYLNELIFSKFLKLDKCHIDISDFLFVKKAALQEYQSQINIFSNKQRGPVLGRSFLKRFLKTEEEFFIHQ